MKIENDQFWLAIFKEILNKTFNSLPTLMKSGNGGEVTAIKNDGDVSLKVEVFIEELALSVVSDKTISTNLYGEESGYLLETQDPRYIVLIDPIDATYLFTRNLSGACLALSVIDVETMEPKAAMIGDLYSGDIYSATQEAAQKNESKIEVSGITRLEDSYVSTCYGKASRRERVFGNQVFIPSVNWINTSGGMLSMAWVGSGQLDAYFDLMLGYKPFDFIAGYHIAKVAGATVSNEFGDDIKLTMDMNKRYKFVIASSKELHSGLLKEYRKRKTY